MYRNSKQTSITLWESGPEEGMEISFELTYIAVSTRTFKKISSFLSSQNSVILSWTKMGENSVYMYGMALLCQGYGVL